MVKDELALHFVNALLGACGIALRAVSSSTTDQVVRLLPIGGISGVIVSIVSLIREDVAQFVG